MPPTAASSSSQPTQPLLPQSLPSPIKPRYNGETKTEAAEGSSWADPLWAAKLMYTVSCAAQSALANFMPVFFEHTAQFTKLQIGLLQTLPCICSIIAPPLWGAIADRLHSHRLVHILSIVTGGILMYSVQFCRDFHLTILVVLLGNFQNAPSGSLLDHAVLDMISKYGGEYGKQRLFGAVGYGAGAYATGLIVAAAGISWAFNTSLIFAFASLQVLRQIPVMKHEPHDEDELSTVNEDGSSTKKLRRVSSFSDSILHIYQQTDVLVLLIVVFLMGLMFGVLSSFLTLNLYNLSGNNAQIIGIAIACETSSELPAFFFSQRIINYLGTVKVLLLSIAGYALRITFYAVMTNAWTAIPFEFLHGITFGIAWAACTQYIYKSAPRGCEGTMMGLLNAVQNGLGRGAGTLIGGYFYEHHGARTMWLVTDLGVPLALLGVAGFAYLKASTEEVLDDDELLLENAEMFSPHSGNPQQLLETPRGGQKYEPLHSEA